MIATNFEGKAIFSKLTSVSTGLFLLFTNLFTTSETFFAFP